MGLVSVGKYKAVMASIGLFLLFVACVFGLNFYMAAQFSTDAASVNMAGQQRMQTERIIKNLLLLENLLLAGAPIDKPLQELKSTVHSFDGITKGLTRGGLATGPKGNAVFVNRIEGETAQALLQDTNRLWSSYYKALEPVVEFDGQVYPDNPEDFYTPEGAELSGDLADAIQAGNDITPKLLSLMDRLSAHLESEATTRASTLRIIQAGAMALALVLFFVIVVYFGRKLRREEAAAAHAKRETDNILGTVTEGLFLLDRNLRIGTACSKSLTKIFRRENIANQKFDNLLKDIVPEKTLAVATDFVGLLWSNRVNEKLIKTLNPLGEVEVHFEKSAGNYETHYLSFDFNRVKVDDQLPHVLVTVSDITDQVLLARALEASKSQSVAQLDLLLGILHVEPNQLTSFLNDAANGLKRVNAILQENARSGAEFQRKVDKIFRELHSIKGEASALGIDSVEDKAHGFEELLNALRQEESLTGNDFLPLTVKLEELYRHLEAIRDLIGRLAELRVAIAREVPAHGEDSLPGVRAAQPLDLDGDAKAIQDIADAPQGEFPAALKNLADRLASGHGKQVALECIGLDDHVVPEAYRKPIKDIAVQFIRNAIVHGIEEPWVRTAAHKSAAGALKIQFTVKGADGYEFLFRDDGQGLVTTNIKTSAVKKKLISAEQAASMSAQQVMSLIFRPGFTTSDVSIDSGRGVGLDIVRSLVTKLGGKLRLSSIAGQHTQFRIELPSVDQSADVA